MSDYLNPEQRRSVRIVLQMFEEHLREHIRALFRIVSVQLGHTQNTVKIARGKQWIECRRFDVQDEDAAK